MSPSSRGPQAATGVQLGLGLLCMAAGTYQSFSSYDDGDILGLLFGVGLLYLGGYFLSPILAEWAGGRAGRLFYPGEKLSRPQPIYSTARSKRAFGQHREALDAYLELLSEHPQALPAWMELLEVALLELKDPELAREHFARGLHILEAAEDKEALGRCWLDLKARAARLKSQAEPVRPLDYDPESH